MDAPDKPKQGNFKVSKVTDLSKVDVGQVFDESDYSAITRDNKFIQMKYLPPPETAEMEEIDVHPGLFTIEKAEEGLKLVRTEFVKDKIIEDMVNTSNIQDAVDCFINNIDLYKEFGIEVAKRNILLYGPQGTGKTTAISLSLEKYLKSKDTLVVVWHTAKWESRHVKDFIKRFKYNDVKYVFIIAEDLGGVEMENQRVQSDASLLSLLDNQEKTFKIPTCIIATTNFPEMFLANIANRPGRFDDKIEVGYPSGEDRVKLMQFFSKNTATQEVLDIIKLSKCEKLSSAHLREIYIRSRIKSKPLIDSLNEVLQEIIKYDKGFSGRASGVSLRSDHDD